MDVTAICNLALAKVGDTAIVSLDDPTPEARFCSLFYQQSVDEVIRLHPWNWATTFTRLSPIDPVPDMAWSYSYMLPVDFGRMITFNAFSVAIPRPTYELANGALYTDEDVAEISYVRVVDNPQEFDPLFTDLVATKIASKLARPLAGSLDIEKTLLNEFNNQIAEARKIDAGENFMPRRMSWIESDLVQSRWSGAI
jgi:hypothetical protein